MAENLIKGTKVLCPRKRHEIGVLNQDIELNSLMRLSVIDFEPGQNRVMGEQCKCTICGSLWLVQRTIHTDQGWWPRDPKLETPPR